MLSRKHSVDDLVIFFNFFFMSPKWEDGPWKSLDDQIFALSCKSLGTPAIDH